MKRGKTEQFKSAIALYMRRRNYPESEIHSRKTQPTDVDEMSVRKRSRISAGVENSVACSSIAGDLTSCDTQFARLRKFVLESSSQQSEELTPLLFPVFVHMYSDLLAAGHQASAHKFHERHTEVFHVDQQKDFVRSLRKLDSRADLQAAKDIMNFREHRHTLRLSHSTISHLLTHLKGADNMVVLQIINQHVNLVGSDTQGRTLELRPSPAGPSSREPSSTKPCGTEDKELLRRSLAKNIKTEYQSPPPPAPLKVCTSWDSLLEEGQDLNPVEREELEKLEEVSRRLESLPPPLPSILFCTVINANAHQGLCTSTVSPDSQLLSGGFEDSSIRLYRLQPVALPTAHTDVDNSRLTLAADYTHRGEGERRMDIDTRSDEGVALQAHCGPVYKTRFTPDSKYLLSCSRDSTVRLWDIARRTNMAIYTGHSASVWDIHYCPATNHFASSSGDLTVKLWSLERLYPLRSFIGHELDVQAVAIHPNGNYLASGSADRTVRLWDIQDGKCLRVMCGHRGAVLALAFSPNGQMLASAGDDRRVFVWDLNHGTVLKELRGHTDTLYCLAFSPCNDLLASGGHDSVIRLWDVRKGGNDRGSASQVEGHTSSELMGAYPTKSATLTSLSFPRYHLLHAVGASQ